ncbi:MAG: efflux RND transporter periplasmic adaptor subunit [Cytophagales bacterium]|nr:efflux RND transporter periplasmic adaptor subunit [Cytophagales bacterium]
MKNILPTHTIIISRYIVKSILAICVVATVVSCGSKNETPASADSTHVENSVTLSAAQLKNSEIVLGKIEQKSISSVLKVNGRIDVPPQNIISISVPMGGYLKYTKLLPGMHLSKGEVIAMMEDQQYIQLQQDFLTAKARLIFAANEYNRQKELNQSKASSDKVFQQTEVDYTTEKINVKSLAERLKLIGINPDKLDENTISKSINIYSPIDGYVSKVNVNIGKFTQPSEVLFELINPADIHLALTIFEKDLSKLSIGQKLFAYTNSQPDKKYECEIILIGKNLSTERSTEVHSHFENYDKSLIPGMYMNAEIEIQNNTVYALPEEAIVRFENNQYVFLAETDTRFTIQEIKTGDVEKGFVEIISGVGLTDKKIVIKGAYNLLMAMKNKVEE